MVVRSVADGYTHKKPIDERIGVLRRLVRWNPGPISGIVLLSNISWRETSRYREETRH